MKDDNNMTLFGRGVSCKMEDVKREELEDEDDEEKTREEKNLWKMAKKLKNGRRRPWRI